MGVYYQYAVFMKILFENLYVGIKEKVFLPMRELISRNKIEKEIRNLRALWLTVSKDWREKLSVDMKVYL